MLTYSSPALRLDLLIRLAEARSEADRLFEIIAPKNLYDRPIPERHRIIFYIGHLESFDWNLLRKHLDLDRFHPEFDKLFAFGIDPVDGQLPHDQPHDWPSLTQVETYRDRIRMELDSALADVTESEDIIQLMNIAIEHRLMHAETLEYMFHQLPFESKIRPAGPALTPAPSATPCMLHIPAGPVTLGVSGDSGQFGWDNEFESHSVTVPAFSIDKYKITNGQFEQFVRAGGYKDQSLWSEADWNWIRDSNITHPVFWVPVSAGFHFRTMFEEIPFPVHAPVFVSQAEASAYARWVGKELPTEAEWQRAAAGAQLPSETRKLWDPLPAGSSPTLQSSFQVEDLLGTGWEWTSTPFAPFAGFKIFPAYPGYSANFFDGKHFVLKGGSTRTAACMLRHSFRNWFQAHYQYVYAGFRCVVHN
jgi:iron(II)-dependent oxidoreductase